MSFDKVPLPAARKDMYENAAPFHRAEDLTCGGRLAQIQHGEQIYTLRITAADKLILTK